MSILIEPVDYKEEFNLFDQSEAIVVVSHVSRKSEGTDVEFMDSLCGQ